MSGARLAASLFGEGLVDEIVVDVPGPCRWRLNHVSAEGAKVPLSLIESETLASGVVESRYPVRG